MVWGPKMVIFGPKRVILGLLKWPKVVFQKNEKRFQRLRTSKKISIQAQNGSAKRQSASAKTHDFLQALTIDFNKPKIDSQNLIFPSKSQNGFGACFTVTPKSLRVLPKSVKFYTKNTFEKQGTNTTNMSRSSVFLSSPRNRKTQNTENYFLGLRSTPLKDSLPMKWPRRPLRWQTLNLEP